MQQMQFFLVFFLLISKKSSIFATEISTLSISSSMIQYPYIPPITGETAERIAEQAEYNFKYRCGSEAPSPEFRARALQMFQQAGLFL